MTNKEIAEELERLTNIYYERKQEYQKASRNRMLLTFVGFAVAFIVVVLLLSQPTMEDILSLGWDSLGMIGAVLLLACMFSGFHMFVNLSIFDWLILKDITENRHLIEIEKEIIELEKTLKQRRW